METTHAKTQSEEDTRNTAADNTSTETSKDGKQQRREGEVRPAPGNRRYRRGRQGGSCGRAALTPVRVTFQGTRGATAATGGGYTVR